MNLIDIIHRPANPVPYSEGEKIPWNDPVFSARMLITDGQVLVDGQAELRKTCKVRKGQRVSLGDVRVLVRAAS